MILGIGKELAIFLQALLTGNFLCLSYQVIKLFRKLVRHHWIWISAEDLMFWVFASVIVFLRLQKNCNGNIRWYFVMGLLGGSLITYYFLRKIAGKYIAKTKER